MAQTAVHDGATQPRLAPRADTATGFMVDLVAGTPVMTLQGVLPVEHILPEDRIITRSGAMRVQSVEARVIRKPDLLRISARALGHDRPEADVLLPPDQPLHLRDWRAKAMFGTAEATVAANRLIDGTHIRAEAPAPVRMIRLVLPRAAVIYAGGLELAAVPAQVSA